MKKEEWTNARLKKKFTDKINNILSKNDNNSYCPSIASFVEVAVMQLIEDIEDKDNKIRWGKNG
ncbi:MAG: hypothetical protein OEL89_01565 [Candidatus Peregrinibacteria bacterium]|nr:hypothetical protein [Candidatus Peregrinibacteria bacterium]